MRRPTPTGFLGFLLAFAASLLPTAPANAAAERVKIADSQGLTHLPIRVAVELHLIEKHAAALGINDVSVSLQIVGSGVVVGELLLSGQADLGVSGNVPLFVISDKTSGKQRVKGIMALAKSNQFLLSIDPRIRSLADYRPSDKIAMTEPKVSTYALTLQMAAAKAFGWNQRSKFEANSIPMSNSDAVAAMLSGATEVKSHFTVLPYTALETASPKVKIILNSRDVVGFPYTSTAAITTEGFRTKNPSLYSAVVAALDEAIDFINKDPEDAAKIFLKYEKYPGGLNALLEVLSGRTPDDLTFTPTPKGTSTFTDIMYRDGALTHKPTSWKDDWFEDIWSQPGD